MYALLGLLYNSKQQIIAAKVINSIKMTKIFVKKRVIFLWNLGIL